MMHRQHVPSIADYYRAVEEETRLQILHEKDDSIIYTETEDLLEYLLANKRLKPIEFDPEKSAFFEHKKEIRQVPASQRDGPYRNEGNLSMEYESLLVTVPIIQNSDAHRVADLQSSTYSSGMPTMTFTETAIYFSIDIKGYYLHLDDAQVTSEVSQKLESLKKMIGWKNSDINGGNRGLEQFVRDFLVARRTKLQEDSSRIAGLVQKINLPLKQRANEAAQRIKLDPKPLVQKVKPNPKLPEEYVLDQQKVLDVISVIDNQGRQFERTAKTYKDMGEEDLRNIILVGLNGLFEGKATAETFSNKGKTDIYLNIDKGNILISEIKIWAGKALYFKTIDQLLGYLTWRHNFGIMISFVKQKTFSTVLEETAISIKEHPSYRRGYYQIAKTHYVSSHALTQDEKKIVEIHHLFYNLYSEPKA